MAMEMIRESIDGFLAESGNIYEQVPPGSGNFVITDYRLDGSPFYTAASANEGWVNLASAVTPTIKGRAKAVADFVSEVMCLNADRPLAKYALNESAGLVLTSDYPAHAHSERFFSDHLVDIRNAQCEEVPLLLTMGQELGIDFGF